MSLCPVSQQVDRLCNLIHNNSCEWEDNRTDRIGKRVMNMIAVVVSQNGFLHQRSINRCNSKVCS